MIVFAKVFVAVESLGGPLGSYEIPNSPSKRFHEWNTRGDNAKVDLKSGLLISYDRSESSGISHILANAFPTPTPLTVASISKVLLRSTTATYKSYPQK